jgi:hypothetical protein
MPDPCDTPWLLADEPAPAEQAAAAAGHLRRYTISKAVRRSTVGATSATVAAAELRPVLHTYGDPWTWILALALLALTLPVVLAVQLMWLRRFATLVTEEGIGLPRLAGRRWIPWPKVQDITIERNGAPLANGKTPKLIVAVYDYNGHRRAVPLLDDRNLAGHGRSLPHDVAAIRATWRRHRGPGWTQTPRIARKAERYRLHPIRSNPIRAGAIAGLIAMPISFLVAGLFFSPPLPAWALLPIFGTPVTLFIAVATITAAIGRTADLRHAGPVTAGQPSPVHPGHGDGGQTAVQGGLGDPGLGSDHAAGITLGFEQPGLFDLVFGTGEGPSDPAVAGPGVDGAGVRGALSGERAFHLGEQRQTNPAGDP